MLTLICSPQLLRAIYEMRQVFFIDYTGALCSKASGHAIDVESMIFLFLFHMFYALRHHY